VFNLLLLGVIVAAMGSKAKSHHHTKFF